MEDATPTGFKHPSVHHYGARSPYTREILSAIKRLLIRHSHRGAVKWAALKADPDLTKAPLITLTGPQVKFLVYKVRRGRHPGIVKPFACALCRERFSSRQGLGTHRRKIHDVLGTTTTPAKLASQKSRPLAVRLKEATKEALAREKRVKAAKLEEGQAGRQRLLQAPTHEYPMPRVTDVRFCPFCGHDLKGVI